MSMKLSRDDTIRGNYETSNFSPLQWINIVDIPRRHVFVEGVFVEHVSRNIWE